MVTTREDYYFDEPGQHNTDDVIEAVKKRLSATGIKHVVAARTSGRTAMKFAKVLGKQAQIISIGHPQYVKEWGSKWPLLNPDYKKKLQKLGVTVLDSVPYVFHSSIPENSKWPQATPEVLLREAFFTLGQGFKVAFEVAMMAVACGVLEPYRDIVGVGGTSRGADTAVILRATYPATVFSKDPNKRLETREIIAMPRIKTKQD